MEYSETGKGPESGTLITGASDSVKPKQNISSNTESSVKKEDSKPINPESSAETNQQSVMEDGKPVVTNAPQTIPPPPPPPKSMEITVAAPFETYKLTVSPEDTVESLMDKIKNHNDTFTHDIQSLYFNGHLLHKFKDKPLSEFRIINGSKIDLITREPNRVVQGRVISPHTQQNLQNDMKVGIAVYKIENNGTATVHHVVEGPGIEKICDYMNGNGNTLQTDVPIASAAANAVTSGMEKNTGDKIISAFRKLDKGLYDTGEKFAKSYLQRRGIMPKDKNITDLTSNLGVNSESVESVTDHLKGISGFDEKKAKEAGNIANQFLQNIPKGGKSRTAKRRASTKHSSSSRRRSGKIKRKSRRLRRRRRQRQTKHRS